MDPATAYLAGAGISALGTLIGGRSQAQVQEKVNDRNIELSREMAKNSIQYKVSDAKSAGIHPLYALGAPTSSAAQVVAPQKDYVGKAMQQMGQAIGNIQTDQQMRANELDLAIKQQELTGLKIKNAGETQKLREPSQVPMPKMLQDAHDWFNYLHATSQFDSRNPTHQLLEDVVTGRSLPVELSENLGGHLGAEAHGGVNWVKSLIKPSN